LYINNFFHIKAQCFLISIFFNKANLAAVVAGIIYFLLYLPYTLLVNYSEVILPWQKFLASLSSTVAFSYGCELIAAYELQAKGLQWSNFYSSPFVSKDDFSMNTVCLILLFDSIVYMVLAWYIENIAPGEYGIPLKWYFPIMPSYWLGESHILTKKLDRFTSSNRSKSKSRLFGNCWFDSKQNIIQQEEERQEATRKANSNSKTLDDSIENITINEQAGIEIEKLHKVYSRGNNHALKGLSIKFYKNEITAFLGHNGAGKSTTMHILTGLYSPTSGTAKINGLDIKLSMDRIRKSLGFVPQHNVLFPGLTVREHLWFYARLKGLDNKSTKDEMEKMLDDTGLRPKKDDLSKNLSGGMQRKLSVAIAFVGGSKTVILDEPSAGVDPSGRRSIWDLLFKFRFDRTIIISTHHMDEADVLGDRIAIISNGKLIAHGTSYFLKHKYGRGYYLTFAKKQLTNEEFKELNVNHNHFDVHSTKSSSSDSGMSTDSKGSKASTPNNEDDEKKSFLHKQNDIDVVDGTDEDEQSESFEKMQLINSRKALETLKSDQDKEIHSFVTSRIENAILVENVGTEMTYSISNKPEYTKSYETYFNQFEKNMSRLGIDSIGISDTTLEEIFIKLAKEPKKNKFKNNELKICCINFTRLKEKFKHILCCCGFCKKEQVPTLSSEQLAEYSKYTKLRVESKITLVSRQLYALLIKRLHRVKRNIKGFFAEIVLPVIFVCLALLVAILTPNPRQRPALELHPWYYGSPNQVFMSRSSSIDFDHPVYNPLQSQIDLGFNPNPTQIQPNLDEINRITNTFLKTFGTRCMVGHKILVTQQAENFVKVNGNDKVLDCYDFDYILNNNYSMPSQSFVDELIQTNFSFTKITHDCDCSNGFPKAPISAGGDFNYRNIFTLKTKDILYDLTGRNLTDFLIKTEFNDQFFRKRFGGYEFIQPNVKTETSLSDNQMPSNFLKNMTQFVNTLTYLLDRLNSLNSSTTPNQIVKPINNINFDGSNPFITPNNVKIWYNPKGYDASVSYLNVINNAFLRSKINEMNENLNNSNYMNPAEHGIVAYNHPMNFTKTQFLDQLEKRIVIDLFVAICMIFALSFIPASFLVFLLEERETNSKQLQFVSGVKPYIYWISNFIWDLINYIVPCCLCIIIFFAFDVKSYTSKENFPYLICLMLLYGWGCIPLMYPLNYLFKLPSTAFVVSSSMNVFIGVISTMTTSILDQLGDDEPDLLQVNKILKPIFLVLFPHYCLGQGFLEMSVLYNTAQAQAVLGFSKSYSPFDFDSGGKNLCALAVQGVLFFFFNLLIQYQFFIRFKPTNEIKKLELPQTEYIDDDVANEKERVLKLDEMNRLNKKKNGFMNFFAKSTNKKGKKNENEINNDNNKQEDFIKLVNLTKVYRKFRKLHRWKKHVAVNAVSLGIKKGECFGLIGVNGAGKTTTFKMITGEIPITGGDVYVNNYSVSKQIGKVHENIGYCPQTDAIMPLLTAREHLIFFARLRGIPEKYVNQVCDWALDRVGLTVFSNRISGDFSGGNKRKLSTAIALVGDPSVICLDEPTSGMDAKARRLLWNDILSLIKENRIVILTSHSMEECEALCTRLVIMVNGQFKCLGSPQHLKRKFGSGFKLVFRLNDESDKNKLFDFMNEKFPTALIQESHKNLFEYILPFKTNKLSDIFGKIEKNRTNLNLKDYSVSQTTLDQIFVSFAKGQNEDPFSNDNNAAFINSDIEAQKLRSLFVDNNNNEINKSSDDIVKITNLTFENNDNGRNKNAENLVMKYNEEDNNQSFDEKVVDLSDLNRDIQYYIEPIKEETQDEVYFVNKNKINLKDVYGN
jgi:ATP-binding cassette subfamily A (ABC1) protein 1